MVGAGSYRWRGRRAGDLQVLKHFDNQPDSEVECPRSERRRDGVGVSGGLL